MLARSLLYCIRCCVQRTRRDQAELGDSIQLLQRTDLVRLGEYIHKQVSLARFGACLFACRALLDSCWLLQIADVLASRSAECSTEEEADLQQVCCA